MGEAWPDGPFYATRAATAACGHGVSRGDLVLDGSCVPCVEDVPNTTVSLPRTLAAAKALLIRSATHGGADTEPPDVAESRR